MANIPRTSLLLCFFIFVLYGGKSQASTTGNVYDVRNYGASTKNGNNKDVSSLIMTNAYLFDHS
jgi:hypothetical protein